jgi:hypothetical protein
VGGAGGGRADRKDGRDLSRAEGCWTFDARDRMPRSSRLPVHAFTAAAENALTPPPPLPRERVRCVPGMLNSSEVKFLYPT